MTVPARPNRAMEIPDRVMETPERYDRLGRRLCEGLQRQSRLPCNNPAMLHTLGREKVRCRIHGAKGFQPGPANPEFKSGRYSRALGTTSLATTFEEARNDPELISLRELLAAHDARLEELFARLGANSAADWERAAQALQTYQDALRLVPDSAPTRLLDLATILREGASAETTWNKIGRTSEQRRKLTDSEGKTEERLNQTFTVANAAAFGAAMAQLAKDYVPPERLRAFVNALRLLTMNGIDTRQEPRRPEARAGN
jgi:hypothetical protein